MSSDSTDRPFPQLRCRVSPSLLPNNLLSNASYLAYIHRNEVYLIDNQHSVLLSERTDGSKCSYSDKETVSSISFAHLNGLGEVLLLASTGGIVHVYDQAGQTLHFLHKLAKSQVALSQREAHLRGLACDGRDTLFVGSGSGEILLFHSSVNGNSKKLELKRKLECNRESIWAVAYSRKDNILAAGDETGGVFVWKFPEEGGAAEGKKLFEYKPTGTAANHPVTSIAVGYGFVCVSYTSGHIRLFSLERRSLAVEIAAHAKSITALSLHPEDPILLASSEDTFFSAWQLPTQRSPSVVNRLMESQSPALLTGVTFAGPNNSLIATAVYDSKSMNFFPSPPSWDL